MRISDWSSDVFSSDLQRRAPRIPRRASPEHEQVGPLELVAGGQHDLGGEGCPEVADDGLAVVLEGPEGAVPHHPHRSEDRRLGKECDRTCRSRGPPDPYKKTEI